MFDSSEAPGKGPKAAKYKANPPQMLKGWEEALEDMREGGIRVLQVPAELAYGKEGVCAEDGSCLVVRLRRRARGAPCHHARALTPAVSRGAWQPPNEKLQFELTLKVQARCPNPARSRSPSREPRGLGAHGRWHAHARATGVCVCADGRARRLPPCRSGSRSLRREACVASCRSPQVTDAGRTYAAPHVYVCAGCRGLTSDLPSALSTPVF